MYLLIGWMPLVLFRGESRVLTRVGLTGTAAQLWALGGAATLVRVLVTALSYGADTSWRRLGQDVQHEWRTEVYPHVQRLELHQMEKERTTRLAGVLTEDMNQLGSFLATGPNEVVRLATCLLGMVPAFLLLAPRIAWVAFLPIPCVVWLSLRHQERAAAGYAESGEKRARLHSHVINGLEASATVKSLRGEEHEASRVAELSDSYRSSSLRADRRTAAYTQAVNAGAATSFLGTLLLGGRDLLSGSLSADAFGALMVLPQQVVWKLTGVGSTVEQYQRTVAAFHRIEHVRSLPVESHGEGRQLDPAQVKGEVVLKDVTFSYPARKPAVQGLSMRIHPGSTTGIVGATGAGKSTIAKLLMRFYAPQSGSVLLDGQDIRHLNLDDLRDAVGFVAQDAFLFDGTISDNLRYGSFDADHSAVVQSARMAEAADFIEALPRQYETVIGERGCALSGGQRQRVALTRAFLKGPPVVVLDEATSAVDNETEAAIQRTMSEFAVSRTLIVIAHRLSTVRQADRIYVMGEGGELVEEGTHQQLLNHGGLYASLWRLQTGEA
ncbi:ABC transporter ATP-binding protein [Streptomyces sp. 8N114]|uniref:ABC transporter ATP-binding protein n=1 Tax=Streptomyces sp. 8N114 TaxID=3457419 RepID=UPI003FCF0B6D